MLRCSKCKQDKPESAFPKHKTNKTGRDSHCKACRKAYQDQYYKDHPDKLKEKIAQVRARNLQKRITEYDRELEAQGGVCAICGSPPSQGRRFARDHCHQAGHRRALLCRNCNVGLGCFKDRPELLRLAAAYVESWS